MIIKNQEFLWFILILRSIAAFNVSNPDESSAREFLESLNVKSAEIAAKLVSAQWEFETSNTERAKKELFQITSETIKNAKLSFSNVVNNYPWRSFSSPDVQRQLKLFSEIGILALPDEKYEQFQKIISDLDVIRQNTTLCDYYNKTKCDLHLNPNIKEKLQTSQNPAELLYLWTEWRNKTESDFKKLLEEYVTLCNEAAQLNNYANFQEYSLRNLEINNAKEEMTSLWEEISPLYQQIHAFVRRKLRDVYGEKTVSEKGPIPAHLLGNIWSEDWSGIAHRMVPYPNLDNLNLTSAMINQGYTSDFIHKLAEDFFVSLNFTTPAHLWFNNTSPACEDKAAENHAKIFNFFNESIRIMDCGKVSLKDFLDANRLMTKAEYMLRYSHQPYVYQSPADPSLEEALNNVVTMSVSTFGNLKKLGLFNDEINEQVRLNRLFKLALEKITLIPFLLVQEFWRWEVYSGKPLEEISSTLTDLREKFQGISTFTKELTFDPGGMGSVFSKISLAHRFFGNFLEFQIYESLCQMSDDCVKKNEVLDECNLNQNTGAGLALRNLMSLGSSVTLNQILAPILGQNKISSKSILKYFDPLMNWLKNENERTGEFIGWEESEQRQEIYSKKIRRKRSLEDYPPEGKDDDTDNTPSREPDRFQRLIHKRSKDNLDESEMIERERKSAENEQDENEMKSMKNKGNLLEDEKERRSIEKAARRSIYGNKRRSLAKNSKNVKDNGKDLANDDEKGNDNVQKSNKFTSRNKKRHSNSDNYVQEYDSSKASGYNLNNRVGIINQKRSDDYGANKNYDNTANGNTANSNTPGNGNSNNKLRYARRARKKQRRYDTESSNIFEQNHEIWRRKDKSQYSRPSRDTQWHTNSKKDISRLLHSFGFAVENDDKEKIKELKKKLKGNKRGITFAGRRKNHSKEQLVEIRNLNRVRNTNKGDSNSDLKSNIASKESTYESMVDYNRMKSGDTRSDSGEEKNTNKLWSVKSYMTENAKALQSNSALDKKDSGSSSRLTGSMVSHATEEKSVGKKETSPNNEQNLATAKERSSESSEMRSQSGESTLRHFNIDVPSLQALLKNADFNAYEQKPVFTMTPEMAGTDMNKARTDMNQMTGVKSTGNKYGSYLYKYTPNNEMLQFKDKKEFRDDVDTGNKSPYIIILGQVTPDMKERLMQEKGVTFLDADKQSQLQNAGNMEEKKMSDKRSRSSEQIYIVPIDFKNSQHNLMKPNHYADHEHEAGHDPNTERDQESEEEQLHLEDNPKLEDKSNFYKTGKENPSEFIISWNNDKNRKIVKRSKRDHSKEAEEKLKVVRIAPMKESILEGLLGKSLDHAGLDDKNVKILIHDGLLNGGNDLSSALTAASSPMGSSGSMSSLMDQSQSAAIQPSSSLSSLASSVLSALSPKSYSQMAKAAGPHQDSDLEEDNIKENAAIQAVGTKEQKEQELPFLVNPGLRCNAIVGKKKGVKLYSDDDTKKLADGESAAKGDDACCKKIILTPCPPKCPSPCPCPCPCPLPCPCPSPCPCPCPCPDPDCCKRIIECPPVCCRPEPDLCCKKPSECSLVNCQFKITKAKKPHERLTIMIYDRINPPAELPEPYDALAVISEILQRIQCCSCKPCCQLTEEDPDYPANDNSDQLKGNPNQQQDNKAKIQELSGEIPILGNDSPEEDETDDNAQNAQNSPNAADEDKYQPKEKATPALDQLTVFNKDKLKPVFIELRKIDDIIKKRSQQK